MALSEQARKNQFEYIKKFSRETYKKLTVYVAIKKEKEILDHLEKQESMSGYIKDLILKDMEKNK